MKVSLFQFAVAVAVVASPFTWASGQEPTQPEKAAVTEKGSEVQAQIDEYANDLDAIHSRAANRQAWNTKQAAVWSEKQCRSCHAANTAESPNFARLMMAFNSVANPLGIEAAPLEVTLRAHLGIEEKTGLVLSSVPEGCEGAKLGLKLHDVVLKLEQQPMNEAERFNRMLQDLQGKKSRFELLRQGKPLAVELTVPKMPLAMAIDQSLSLRLTDVRESHYRIGVTLSEADDTLRSHLKLEKGEGLVVTEVIDDSPAAKMGVKLHDVLTELDGKRLTSVDAINSQIQEIKEKSVLLKLLRSGQDVTCQIAPKKSDDLVTFLNEIVLVDEQARHPTTVRWLTRGAEAAPTAADAAAQLAELKKQLAELGKTVEKLEAVIAPPAPPAEEQKPEGSTDKK
jgi:C-terminal processing protease CtpA/Prc